MTQPGFARHLCLSVDARNYGQYDDRDQETIQRDLTRLLDDAAGSARLDRASWHRQPGGDSELSLIPLDGGEPRVLDDFIRHLDHELGRYNRFRLPEARLRVRVAVHQGVSYQAPNGYAGAAVVAVSRLRDSPQLRAALASAPAANLALIVSDPVYRDIIQGGHCTTGPGEFRPVTVRVKEFVSPAWIRVPGYDPTRLSVDPADDRRPDDRPTGSTQQAAAQDGVVTQIAGDLHGGIRIGSGDPDPTDPPGRAPERPDPPAVVTHVQEVRGNRIVFGVSIDPSGGDE